MLMEWVNGCMVDFCKQVANVVIDARMKFIEVASAIASINNPFQIAQASIVYTRVQLPSPKRCVISFSLHWS